MKREDMGQTRLYVADDYWGLIDELSGLHTVVGSLRDEVERLTAQVARLAEVVGQDYWWPVGRPEPPEEVRLQ